MKSRSEREIFADLEKLCKSPGFIHIIAAFCLRDNSLSYAKELLPDDLSRQYSKDRLIRTEISTLIGLLAKCSIDYEVESETSINENMEKAEALLREFHDSLNAETFSHFTLEAVRNNRSPLKSSSALRESIFYAGESAYYFQYSAFSKQKYSNDSDWIKRNKGFSIDEAHIIIEAITKIIDDQAQNYFENARKRHELPSPLSIYAFHINDLIEKTSIDVTTLRAFLSSMELIPGDSANQAFNSFSAYNEANSLPLLRLQTDNWALFQQYSIVESIYESPFYWMNLDPDQKNIAAKNRGEFLENFTFKKMVEIFGQNRVYKNVKLYQGKNVAGEVDILIRYSDRIILFQCKSKKLTLKSRSGDTQQINSDFKDAIQSAYDQAESCGNFLLDKNIVIKDCNDNIIHIPDHVSEILPICLTSENYPSLSLQVSNFLKVKSTNVILNPFVMDIFTLDVLCEFLTTPLLFLSYIIRRAHYWGKIISSHELTVLSFHLRNNLWIEDDLQIAYMTDDISAELDSAMLVRRLGYPGKAIPDGILTKNKDTFIGKLIENISTTETAGALELGIALLQYSEVAVKNISLSIIKMMSIAKSVGHSDITLCNSPGQIGFTIHCNLNEINQTRNDLARHCVLRKYKERSDKWVGICINPFDSSIRCGLLISSPWEFDEGFEELTADLPNPLNPIDIFRTAGVINKVGRNDECPCGSSKKYKKCCLNKTYSRP